MFTDARLVLDQPDSIEFLDLEHSVVEDRFIAIGEVRGRIAVVVYAQPGENRIRIISMRPASSREKKRYQRYRDQFQ